MPFFQTSLKNSELKTTFWDCCMTFSDTFLKIAVYEQGHLMSWGHVAVCAEVIFSAFTRIHQILL